MILCIIYRSFELADSAVVDDLMSKCTAALMQEQVKSLSDTDAGNICFLGADALIC